MQTRMGDIIMVLEITLGSPTADSYVTVSEADSRFVCEHAFQEELEWGTLATSLRESVLVSATRSIDALRLRGTRFFAYAGALARDSGLGQEQALAFPRNDHPYLSGQAGPDSTAEILKDSALARPMVYPDQFFAGGSVQIVEGTNRFELRGVTAYNAEAGSLTLNPAFPQPLDAGSRYRLLYPLPVSVKLAQIAQARAIVDQSIRTLRLQGYGVKELRVKDLSMKFERMVSLRSIVCPEALVYLSPYLACAAHLDGDRVLAR